MLRLSQDLIDVENRMDEMAAQIETKLTSTRLRSAMAKFQTLTLVHTALDVLEDHAEVSMSWDVAYANVEGIPSIAV
jgi:hypothetical protein